MLSIVQIIYRSRLTDIEIIILSSNVAIHEDRMIIYVFKCNIARSDILQSVFNWTFKVH